MHVVNAIFAPMSRLLKLRNSKLRTPKSLIGFHSELEQKILPFPSPDALFCVFDTVRILTICENIYSRHKVLFCPPKNANFFRLPALRKTEFRKIKSQKNNFCPGMLFFAPQLAPPPPFRVSIMPLLSLIHVYMPVQEWTAIPEPKVPLVL